MKLDLVNDLCFYSLSTYRSLHTASVRVPVLGRDTLAYHLKLSAIQRFLLRVGVAPMLSFAIIICSLESITYICTVISALKHFQKLCGYQNLRDKHMMHPSNTCSSYVILYRSSLAIISSCSPSYSAIFFL